MTFAAEDDVLEYEPAPRRRGVWLAAVLVFVMALALPAAWRHHRQQVQKHDRVAYEQLLALSADGEASVEQAISQTRDVAQYAEPLLNSQLTSTQTRATLYQQVKSAQEVSGSTIDVQRQRLEQDTLTGHSHRLRAARQATLAYLAGWSAMFSPASSAGFAESTDDLAAKHATAVVALQAAAPDAVLAAQAGVVLGGAEAVQ